MHLVIGATGQLGTRIVRRLSERGEDVRAFVRPTSAHRHFEGLPGVDLAQGDLRDRASVEAACDGARTVLATAAVVAPRNADSIRAVEGEGYEHLIRAAERAGVEQFIMVSLPASGIDRKVPTFRFKRLNERRLASSPVPSTVIRASMFMSSWLALIGSSIPLRGLENASLERPWWFLRRFRAATGTSIEAKGKALIPGPGHHRNAFIDDADVADAMVAAIGRGDAENVVWELGGPEILDWDDVVAIYSRLLERPVRSSHTPAPVFRAMQLALRPFAPAASNIMGLNWWAATNETPWETDDLAASLGLRRTRVEEYLRARVQRNALLGEC